MSEFFECFIPGEPSTLTHQHGVRMMVNRDGQPRMYRTKTFDRLVMAYRLHIRRCKPREWRPIDSAAVLIIDFHFGWLDSHPKKVTMLGKYPKVTKPDTDNLVKALKDCLEAEKIVVNDSRFYQEHSAKYFSNEPGIYIKVIAEALP